MLLFLPMLPGIHVARRSPTLQIPTRSMLLLLIVLLENYGSSTNPHKSSESCSVAIQFEVDENIRLVWRVNDADAC